MSLPNARPLKILYLGTADADPTSWHLMDEFLGIFENYKKIIVVAGAGISVSAGVPDFRSANGLFRSGQHRMSTLSGKHLFQHSVYQNDAATYDFHNLIAALADVCSTAKPTPFHATLNTISAEGRLLRLYTQNIDGLDTRMTHLSTATPLRRLPDGNWPKTVQIHGSITKMCCFKCSAVFDLEATKFATGDAPDCPDCQDQQNSRVEHGLRHRGGGFLRPRITLYGEPAFDEDAIAEVVEDDAQTGPDALLVVGTTLTVPGAQKLVQRLASAVRRSKAGMVVWLNPDPKCNMEVRCFLDMLVVGECDEVASRTGMGVFE